MRRVQSGPGYAAVVGGLVTGAEASLLVVLVALLSGQAAEAPAVWAGLWAVGMAAFLLPRLLTDWPAWSYSLAVALSFLGSTLILLKLLCYPHVPLLSPEWLADLLVGVIGLSELATRSVPLLAAAVSLLWWRQLARRTPDGEDLGALLRLGALPVAALAVWGAQSWGADGVRFLGRQLLASLVLMLVALAYAQAAESPSHGAGRGALLGRWLGSSVLPVVLVVVLVSAVSGLVFGSDASLVHGLLSAVFTALSWVVLVLTLLFRTVVLLVIRAIFWVLSPFLEWLAGRGLRLPELVQPPLPEETQPPDAGPLLRADEPVTWLLYAAGVVLLFVLLTRRRRRAAVEERSSIQRESAWEELYAGEGLRSLWGRLRGVFAKGAADPLDSLLADPVWRHTGEVRRVYRAVAALYRDAGRGREPGQTPWEYSESLRSEPMTRLTRLYQDARYSTRPSPEAVAIEARALAEDVRADLLTRNGQ